MSKKLSFNAVTICKACADMKWETRNIYKIVHFENSGGRDHLGNRDADGRIIWK
jgi:hypothetical protein